MYFHDFFSSLFQLHNQAETEKHVKSKTKQNLELSAKNKELTQSLKQLHQSFLATNQVRGLEKIITYFRLLEQEKRLIDLSTILSPGN